MRPEVTVDGLFDAIGFAGHDIARAIREDDADLGERASSALCNALGMLPDPLRQSLIGALVDRSQLAPILQGMAL